MNRRAMWVGLVAVIGVLQWGSSTAAAASLVLEVSGTFGTFNYGNEPAPLNGGSFSGTVTLPTLPVSSGPDLVNINFYDQSGHLVFNLGGNGGDTYDTLAVDNEGNLALSVNGAAYAGSTLVSVSGLGMVFDNWSAGQSTGVVLPYGAGTPADYGSAISYTYPGSITYYNPVLSGQAVVPEPSTLALGLLAIFAMAARTLSDRPKARG